MSTAVAVVAAAVVVVVVVAIGSMMLGRSSLCAGCIRLVRTIGMCLCGGRPRAL